jgi:hypothetical protein
MEMLREEWTRTGDDGDVESKKESPQRGGGS